MTIHYKNKHEAIMKMQPWRPLNVGVEGLFPSVGYSYGLTYEDGSGDPEKWQSFVVNASNCPYRAEHGIDHQNAKSGDLYLGLIAAAPELYKVLHAMVQKPTGVNLTNAKALLERVASPTKERGTTFPYTET